MEDLKFVSLATTYEVDNSFDSERFKKLKLKICHDGENPNKSSFHVNDIVRAESSIANTPILANTIVDEDNQTVDLGGHDFHIEKHKLKDDEYKIIYDELVVGVVPETNNYQIVECDGRNYAFADCYIFLGYCNYFEDFMNENKEISLSMEILVDNYNYDKVNNTYNITDFRYKGITFLGNSYGTGMIGAKATQYSEKDKKNLFTLLSDLKSEIERYQSSLQEEVDINTFSKKEDLSLDEKMKLLEQYSLSVESLDFSIDEISIEDLKLKLDEFSNKNEENENESHTEENTTDNFALNGQFMEELIEKLSIEKIESDWGSYSKYSFVDYDGEVTEVYCFDRQDWKLYGFTYSVNGDAISIDFETKKRKKFSIVDFVDGFDNGASFESATKEVFDCMITNKNSDFEKLQKEFEAYKSDYSTPNSIVKDLEEFKSERIASEHKEQLENALAEFSDLNDIDEFKTLCGNAMNYSNIDDLVKDCYAIRGKNIKVNFANNQSNSVKAPLNSLSFDVNDDGFGGLLCKVYTDNNN